MELLVRTWTFMFWLPALASAGMAWFALASGILARPLPVVLWCATALLLQFSTNPFSVPWTVGLVAQSGLAIYLSIRLKLDA